MGQYFKIVNPVKRQYLDAIYFNESIKAGGVLLGHHGRAVALLVSNVDQVPGKANTVAGSWFGDPIIVAGDYAPPDTHGIKTSTDDEPHRNLYFMARHEFEDISYKAIAMLCEYHQGYWGYAEILTEQSAEFLGNYLLVHLGNVVFGYDCKPLREALEQVYGSDWTAKYKKAKKEHEESSLIDYRGHWIAGSDMALGVWLMALVSEIDSSPNETDETPGPPPWLKALRDEWYLQAIAAPPGRMSAMLDEYITSDERKEIILSLAQHALDNLVGSRQFIRVDDAGVIRQGHPGDASSEHVRNIGLLFMRLLRGEIDRKLR